MGMRFFPRSIAITDLSPGSSLIRKYKAAIIERNLQVEAHRGLTESLPDGLAEEWEHMCVEWEEDGFPKSKPNPYEIQGARTCLRLRLIADAHIVL